MVVIFPFEVSWYNKRGVHVKYFGHPLLDNYSKSNDVARDDLSSTPQNLTIGLFPGSRKQEIKKHIPVMQGVIDKLELYYEDDIVDYQINIIVGVVDNKEGHDINPMFGSKKWKINYIEDSFDAFEKSDVAVVASGTATLECAITETPMVVVYKMSKISWWISKYFIKIPFASIVNILSEKPKGVVKEFLQSDCTSAKISLEVNKLLSFNRDEVEEDEGEIKKEYEIPRNKQKREMKKIIKKLGNGNAYQQTANFIIKL